MKKLRQGKRIVLYSLYILTMIPEFLKTLWSPLSIVSMGIRGIAGIVTILIILTQKKRSQPIIYLILYIGYILIITLIRSFSIDNIIRYISIYVDIFTISVLTNYLLENDTKKYISIMNTLAWIGLLLNAASVFLMPNGIVRVANEMGKYAPYYFYDYDNHFIIRYAASLAIIFMYQKYYKGYEKGGSSTVIAMLIGLSTLIRLRSIASMAAMIFLLALYILMDYLPKKITSISTVWVSYLVVSVVVTLGVSFTFTTNIISSLGKTTSLFKRTTMWLIATHEISESFLFGTGLKSSSEMRSIFGFAQLHNTLLTTLLWGGVIGLILYSLFIFSIQSSLKKAKDQTVSRFMTILFATMMVASIVDGIELLSNVYMLYFIIANSEKICEAFSIDPKSARHRRKIRIRARSNFVRPITHIYRGENNETMV